jgi:hypothetical protein
MYLSLSDDGAKIIDSKYVTVATREKGTAVILSLTNCFSFIACLCFCRLPKSTLKRHEKVLRKNLRFRTAQKMFRNSINIKIAVNFATDKTRKRKKSKSKRQLIRVSSTSDPKFQWKRSKQLAHQLREQISHAHHQTEKGGPDEYHFQIHANNVSSPNRQTLRNEFWL